MADQESIVLYDAAATAKLVRHMAEAVVARHPDLAGLALVGIRTGGAFLARRLMRSFAGRGFSVDTGAIDITLYRDDWTRLHARPRVGKTDVDFSVDDRPVLLVDDVLYTGRTVRAAMDAVIDLGRPRRIELAVLVDRGWRELPIQPDYVGAKVETGADQMVDVLLREEGANEDAVVIRPR